MRNNPRFTYFYLLSQAVRIDKGLASQAAATIIQENNIDWEEMYLLAELNAVRPQLYTLLRNLSPGKVPTAVLEKLSKDLRDNLYLHLQNTGEFLQLKDALDKAAVEAVPFKGFSLASDFYENPSERESVDIDIYIHPADLEKIKAIMAVRLYSPEEPLEELTDEYILSQLCEYNFDKYKGDTRVFHIEFHWRVSMTVFGLNITLDDLRDQVVDGTIQQRSVRVFSPSAHLLLAVFHHGGKDQFATLKQVLDIANILQQPAPLDWPWIINMAKKFHSEKLLYVAVSLSVKITGCPIPNPLQDKVSGRQIEKLALNRIAGIRNRTTYRKTVRTAFNNFYFQLRSRNNLALQLNIIAHELRRNMLPSMLPKKWRSFFINQQIRQPRAN